MGFQGVKIIWACFRADQSPSLLHSDCAYGSNACAIADPIFFLSLLLLLLLSCACFFFFFFFFFLYYEIEMFSYIAAQIP